MGGGGTSRRLGRWTSVARRSSTCSKGGRRRSRCAADAMATDDRMDEVYGSLRRLVASDPKQARAVFLGLLSGPPEAAPAVLERASRPGEGRVRQMIATAARVDAAAAGAVEPWLRRWLAAEADEFTRGAIVAALP